MRRVYFKHLLRVILNIYVRVYFKHLLTAQKYTKYKIVTGSGLNNSLPFRQTMCVRHKLTSVSLTRLLAHEQIKLVKEKLVKENLVVCCISNILVRGFRMGRILGKCSRGAGVSHPGAVEGFRMCGCPRFPFTVSRP